MQTYKRVLIGVLLLALPAWGSSGQTTQSSTGLKQRAEEEQAQQLSAAVRSAKARMQSLQLMSVDQRKALGRLNEQSGGGVDIRIRPDFGTPRMIQLPKVLSVVPNVMTVKPEPSVAAYRFLNSNRDLLLLADPEQELRLERQEADELGHTHLRFSQRYLGLEVWAAELIVHVDPQGSVESLDGCFVPSPLLVATTPMLDAEQAVQLARATVPDGATAPASVPQLLIYASGNEAPRLAWKLEAVPAADARWLVLVDALNGAILKAFNQVASGNVTGSGVDLLGATRPLNVWQQGNTYYLVDASKPMFDPNSAPPGNPSGAILVVDANHQTLPSNGTLTCAQITSTSRTSGWMGDGVSAAFGLSQTYDYYRARHGRNSIDGQGGNMISIVRYGQNYRNAFWNGQAMFFGDGEPFAGALDVVGHELTHGVVSHTANLVYQNQSGALNEALADIFGGMVQAWEQGTNNWLVGEDLGQAARSMSDPGSRQFAQGRPFPAKMSEFVGPNDPALAQMPNQDNGGVHINSTIISHAFYLLSVGLPDPLSPTNTAAIFYRALTAHMVAQSEFLDCRLACIQSAKELFGDTSVQAQKTGQAFDAVEIFDSTVPPPTPPNTTVTNVDSALLVYYDAGEEAWYLARREDDLGDPPYGTPISQNPVNPSRPSVTGDGSFAAFVSDIHDMCLIGTDTDGSETETSLGYPGLIASVAMAPDGEHYAFVLQDLQGQRQNQIAYVNISGAGEWQTITLKAPSDAGPVNSIFYADTLCFTPDNRFIVYDALNLLQIGGATTNQAWSIYAYDLKNNRTVTLVAPVPAMNICNPAVGHTGNDLLTYEMRDQNTRVIKVMAANLRTGTNQVIGSVNNVIAWPCYNGDDTEIVYSQPDAATQTGASLVRQGLAPDHITPVGAVTQWVEDGQCGFAYRRGTYTAPTAEKSVDLSLTASATPTQVAPGNNITFTVTVLNHGPDDATSVTLVNTLPANTLYLSSQLSQGSSSNANGRITCHFGALAKGNSASATFIAQADTAGQACNIASIVCDQTDPNPADNGATATVMIETVPGTALITVLADPPEGGAVGGGGSFAVGTQQTITATPNPGWFFRQWQDGPSENPRTVTVVAGGATYVADFQAFPNPEAMPKLSLPQYRNDGQFQFNLAGASGSNYEVRVSADLMSWQLLRSVSLVGSSSNILDTSTTALRRFYKAKLVP